MPVLIPFIVLANVMLLLHALRRRGSASGGSVVVTMLVLTVGWAWWAGLI